jgi:hypothetical protein
LNIACKVFIALFINWLENAALAYYAVRPKIPVVKTARKRRKPVCASVERRVVRVSPPSMGTEVVLKVNSAFWVELLEAIIIFDTPSLVC